LGKAVDVQQLVPMLEKTREINGSQGGQFLADAGYCSAGNLEHVASLEESVAGRSEFFIATGRLKHGEQVPDAPGADPCPGHRAGAEGEKTENKEGSSSFTPAARPSSNRSSAKSTPGRANTSSCADWSKPPTSGT
jgi:hypothetical protein